MANTLAGWSGTWKEHDRKIAGKKAWRRAMWIDSSEWARKIKMFVSYINAYLSVTSAEEDFNSQVNSVHSLDNSWPLSPVTTVIIMMGS